MVVPASDSVLYSHGHSLDSVAEMAATATSATVLNVVGMIGIEAGPSVQNVAMKMQWCGLLPSLSLSRRHPSLFTAPASSTRPSCCPFPKGPYTSSASDALSRSATAPQGMRFPSTITPQSRSPPPDRQNLCTHWAPSTHQRYPNSSPLTWSADSAREAQRRLTGAAGSSFLTTNLSVSISAMSSAHCRRSSAQRGALHYPRRATRSSPHFQVAFRPRIIAPLDNPPQG